MAAIRRSHSDRLVARHLSSQPAQRISPLVILQARFQQRQLQEKEEKLVKLYEEQQERALKSVGSRSQSGGSSVSSSSSVGVGKVRHMFQSRREDSEPRLATTIRGRDKSHPLEPLTDQPNGRHLHDNRRANATWSVCQHDRSFSLDRNENRQHFGKKEILIGESVGVRRSESQTRGKAQWGSEGKRFSLVEEWCGGGRYRTSGGGSGSGGERERGRGRGRGRGGEGEVSGRGGKGEEREELGCGEVRWEEERRRMEGRYKNYVSQGGLGKKGGVGNVGVGGSSGAGGRQGMEVKESGTRGYSNGSVSSPVRKIRKPTPVPLSVAPQQHLLQKEMRKTGRIETIREVPSSMSTPKSLSSRAQSLTGSVQKPPTPGKSLPSTRAPPMKTISTAAARSAALPSDLVNCRVCGRHFAADRVSKHEEVCQKSSRNKRKPFDALQQRVKGTEVEQFIKKTTRPSRAQPEKASKPHSNWRKKHEEFINNIRAAKEVSAHLKKGGKLSDLPPPPPSDYSDYIPCPHCGRKFSASAAERHIPKCANIINNKPKPNLHKTAPLKHTTKILQPPTNSFRGRK